MSCLVHVLVVVVDSASNRRLPEMFSIMLECNKLPVKATTKTTYTKCYAGAAGFGFSTRGGTGNWARGSSWGWAHVYARTLIYFCCHFASGPHLKCAAGRDIKQIQMTKHRQWQSVRQKSLSVWMVEGGGEQLDRRQETGDYSTHTASCQLDM